MLESMFYAIASIVGIVWLIPVIVIGLFVTIIVILAMAGKL